MSITNVNVYNRPGHRASRRAARGRAPAPSSRRAPGAGHGPARRGTPRAGNEQPSTPARARDDQPGRRGRLPARRTRRRGRLPDDRSDAAGQRLRRQGRQRLPAATRQAAAGRPTTSGKWKPVAALDAPEHPAGRTSPSTRPRTGSPSSPPARPAAAAAAATRPAPRRPTVDPGTLNQLSRDQKGRDRGNYRANPPQPVRRPSRPAPAVGARAAAAVASAEEARLDAMGRDSSLRLLAAASCSSRRTTPRAARTSTGWRRTTGSHHPAQGLRRRLPDRRLGLPAARHRPLARRARNAPRRRVLRHAHLADRLVGAPRAAHDPRD